MNVIEWFGAGFLSAIISLVLLAMFAAKYALRHPQLVVRMFMSRNKPSGNTQ